MITLRPVRPDDVNWLVDLRIATMGGYLRASGETLTREDQAARVAYAFDDIRVVEDEAEPIGMIKVTRAPDVWKLVQIQMLPDYQGRGIGTRLIGALQEEAHALGQAIELSVLNVNPALRLYERLGFAVVERKQRSTTMRWVP